MSAGQLVVGTAGHIDHGKSRLVWTLTGVNPDRLPEEQARGMTIDLGFAHTAIDGCDVWFVDVPGHERFLRHMVAGATGVDVAMLVVAADDSVMPQTREHAEVLALLGVERCLIVLTKLDLVDDDWAAAVEDESRALLRSIGIEPIGCVWTSAETQRGFDELRARLADLARDRVKRDADAGDGPGWFRLPIDRAFNAPGRGVVVTGSVAHGTVKPDDELTLWPAGTRVRVRGLQSHSQARAAAAGRMRLAVNLAGVSLDEVRRGCELATPGYLEATNCLDVYLPMLRMPGKTVRRTIRLRLHTGTSEVLAKLRLCDDPTTADVRDVYGQLLTAEPIVAAHSQPFIVRDESGARTLGGGRILRPVARLWTAKRPANLDGLRVMRDGAPLARLEEVLRDTGWQPLGDAAIAARSGFRDSAAVATVVRQLGVQNRLVAFSDQSPKRERAGHSAANDPPASSSGGAPIALHADIVQAAGALLAAKLSRHLAEHPRLPGLPLAEWRSWMPKACPARLRPLLADWLIEKGHVVAVDGFVVPRGHAAAMPAEDQALLAEILREYEAAGFQPPTLDALRCATVRNGRRIRELVDLACARGALIRVADGVWLGGRTWAAGARRILDRIRAGGGVTVADLRDLLGSSRKFVVPLAEYADSIGLTRRQGDLRVAGAKADAIVAALRVE